MKLNWTSLLKNNTCTVFFSDIKEEEKYKITSLLD